MKKENFQNALWLKCWLAWILVAVFAVSTYAQTGIWSSAQELATIPMQGQAWRAIQSASRKPISYLDLSDQNNHTGVYVLARAIAWSRDSSQYADYRDEAIAAIRQLVQRGHPGGRTLAWARNITAYVLAADLIGYHSPEFNEYLTNLAEVWECSQVSSPYRKGHKASLREMFEKRPNNWGAHAFAALAAIYRYLDRPEDLAAIRDYWLQAVEGPKPSGLDYGKKLCKGWMADESDPRWINPKNAEKCGINIDGMIPAEMARGSAFSCEHGPAEFTFTRYAWEGLQGMVVAARILERAGMPIWAAGDSAIYRAAFALQERLGSLKSVWQARSYNSGWLLVFLDAAYGTNWAQSLDDKPRRKWGHGRGAGFGFVTLAQDTSSRDSTGQTSQPGTAMPEFAKRAAQSQHSANPGMQLLGNFPNPFNAGTRIRFFLRQENIVTLKIYDLTGREVAVLADGHYRSGPHDVLFEPANLSSGVYYAVLRGQGVRQVRQLNYLK